MTTSLSVIIPNVGEATLAAQVQEIQEQALGIECDVEVILAVNSTDALARVADEFTADSRVFVLDATQRTGPSYARNRGAQRARGSTLLFCDADDLIGNLWLSTMHSLSGTFRVFGTPLQVQVDKVDHDWKSSPATLSEVFGRQFLVSASMGVSKEVFEQVGGWNETLRTAEDIDLSWRLADLGYQLGFSSSANVQYTIRVHRKEIFVEGWRYSQGLLAVAHAHSVSRPERFKWIFREFASFFKRALWPSKRNQRIALARAGAVLGGLSEEFGRAR